MKNYEKKVENLEEAVGINENTKEADIKLLQKLEKLVEDFMEYVEEEKGNPERSLPLEESCNLRQTAWEIAEYKKTGEFEGRFLDKQEFDRWLELYKTRSEAGPIDTEPGLEIFVHKAREYEGDKPDKYDGSGVSS